jgi:hypothetical protein
VGAAKSEIWQNAVGGRKKNKKEKEKKEVK